jgi:hypothetical protein
MNAGYIQPGHPRITPYLYGRIDLIDCLKLAFGAEEVHRGEPDASGRVHCEVRIGGSMLPFGTGYFADATMAAASLDIRPRR